MRGGGGCRLAMWGAARSAGDQGCRAKPAEEAEARCVLQREYRLATRRPSYEALGAEHRSAVARRPQAVADRGRHRAPDPHATSRREVSERRATRASRFAPAKRQRRRHDTSPP